MIGRFPWQVKLMGKRNARVGRMGRIPKKGDT